MVFTRIFISSFFLFCFAQTAIQCACDTGHATLNDNSLVRLASNTGMGGIVACKIAAANHYAAATSAGSAS